MHLQRPGDGIRQRTYLLHTKANRATPTDTTQLLGNLLGPIRLREWAEYAQVERDQAAQSFGQGRDITSGLTNVDEDLQWPMLVAVDCDVHLPFRSTHLAG